MRPRDDGRRPSERLPGLRPVSYTHLPTIQITKITVIIKQWAGNSSSSNNSGSAAPGQQHSINKIEYKETAVCASGSQRGIVFYAYK